MTFGMEEWDIGLRIREWDLGLVLGIRIWVWGSRLRIRIGFRLTLVYRLKIIFELEGYLISCADA